MIDIIQYLNQSDSSPFVSKLLQSIQSSKQGRASAPQWAAFIKALTQKGVKQLEIEDLGILDWLASQGDDVITREDLVHRMRAMTTTVKEVELGNPKYAGYVQPGGKYHEILYIANSESAMIRDEIERIEDEMSFLGMEPERIDEDPELPIRLERNRADLMRRAGKAVEYAAHHFSDIIQGKLGKNLLAHARVKTYPQQGLYFIQEIQSDWAQRGRKCDFKGIPRGPFITNTEAWAGMVLRRQLQRAARDHGMNSVAWITETMRNGHQQDLALEARKRAQAEAYAAKVKELTDAAIAALALPSDATQDQVATARKLASDSAQQRAVSEFHLSPPHDDLNVFYLRTIPKIVDKILAGTGVKTELKEFTLGDRTVTVPSIVITDAVREKLADKQPLYSRGLLHSTAAQVVHDDAAVAAVMHEAELLTGSPHKLRLAMRLLDVATGRDVAGKYLNEIVQVSLQAKNLMEVTRHECFHYAQDCLLSARENSIVERAFTQGSELHARVIGILTARNDFELAKHCRDPRECAAQGFALWCDGTLELLDDQSADESTSKGLVSRVVAMFRSIRDAVVDVTHWLSGDVVRNELKTVESVFQSLATGVTAKERADPKDGLERHARYRALSQTPI